uniref:Uncharacterized protein n=1 Tax=Oryza punctata TaxID=4537 RepID=A0A0E0JU14_ORYPU
MGIGFSSSVTGCAFSCRIRTSHSNGLMRLIEASVIMAAAADVGSGSPSISVPMEAEVSMQSLKNKMVHTISVMSNQNGESNN